ncbi:MAG: formylglycine-generating enzyme family protein [Planctomycetes bacterium]|nr:formylglycine-generating enzyme family protein [Planctomycetota bacterium]
MSTRYLITSLLLVAVTCVAQGPRPAPMTWEPEGLLIMDDTLGWERTINAIAKNPRYHGLRLKPQAGIVPLGADPVSGLEEFAYPESGTVPQRHARTRRLILTDDTCMVFVLVPGGTFTMGAQKKDADGPNHDPGVYGKREGPTHDVTLLPFFISKYEMTQAQWLLCTGKKPSFFQFDAETLDPRHPVEQVSWAESVSALKDLKLDLPTEAQWEYACRAGTRTPWNTGAEESFLRAVATVDAESTTDVGSYAPNGFGLHDMHGNVWEWCRDAFKFYGKNPVRPDDGLRSDDADARFRVYRGGGFVNVPRMGRSSARHYGESVVQENDVGVRAMRPVTVE